MSLRIRQNARLILLDADYRVWLLRINDPVNPRWILPGGGLEDGESWEEAARRELWEECAINDAEIGPLVATRRKQEVYHQQPYISDGRYYLVNLQQQQPSDANMYEYELADYTRQRWFSADDICQSPEPVYPVGLAELLDHIRVKGVPDAPVEWEE